MTAAIAPSSVGLMTLTIALWYTDWQGLSRTWEVVSDQPLAVSQGEEIPRAVRSRLEAESRKLIALGGLVVAVSHHLLEFAVLETGSEKGRTQGTSTTNKTQ